MCFAKLMYEALKYKAFLREDKLLILESRILQGKLNVNYLNNSVEERNQFVYCLFLQLRNCKYANKREVYENDQS